MKSDESEYNSEFGSGTMGGRYGESTQITGCGVHERRAVISITCEWYLIRLFYFLFLFFGGFFFFQLFSVIFSVYFKNRNKIIVFHITKIFCPSRVIILCFTFLKFYVYKYI